MRLAVDSHRSLTQCRCLFASTTEPPGRHLMALYAEFLTVLPGWFSMQIKHDVLLDVGKAVVNGLPY